MTEPTPIRGAIFDADGVLLDSLFIWKNLGSRYLQKRGRTAAPDLDARLFSMSLEQGAHCLKREYALQESEEALQRALQEMLRDFYVNEVGLKGGAAALLRSFSEKNIPVALATSSPRAFVEKALRRNGIFQYFEGRIFTTGELGTSKHTPEIYLAAAEALGTAPAETLVFEDSLYALRTAKAAGFRTVGVYDADGEPDQEGLKEEADVYGQSLWAQRWLRQRGAQSEHRILDRAQRDVQS